MDILKSIAYFKRTWKPDVDYEDDTDVLKLSD